MMVRVCGIVAYAIAQTADHLWSGVAEWLMTLLRTQISDGRCSGWLSSYVTAGHRPFVVSGGKLAYDTAQATIHWWSGVRWLGGLGVGGRAAYITAQATHRWWLGEWVAKCLLHC